MSAPPDVVQSSARTARRVARVAGALLLLAFFGLAATSNGTTVTFRGNLTTSSPGELNLWLGFVLLLCPAALLIAYGFATRLVPFAHALADSIRGLTLRERRMGVIALTLVAVAAARIGRAVFLLDLPITDDEYAVDFGGRILATGHVLTNLGLPRESIPALFLHFRDGLVGSFDWIGGQAVAAVGEATRLGSFVWAMLAATPVAALAVLTGRRLGPIWGGMAACLFLISPMAALLSMTTHAHLASRAFFALALFTFSAADKDGTFSKWAMTGVFVGASFLCRPLETACLAAPIAVWAAIQTVRRAPEYRQSLPGLIAGFVPAAVIFLWHAYAMTGNPFLPARFAATENADVASTSLWTRFGDNFTYNLLMLAIWFLGPLGLVLVAAGVLTDRFTRLLGICVATDLALALLHDNSGLHIVGPIHYSECAVPLTVIGTYGLANLAGVARRYAADKGVLLVTIVLALVIGLGTFTFMQASALRRQAAIQRSIYDAVARGVRDPGGRRAVVLTPWFFAVSNAQPDMREIGTWVHDWRRPRIDLQDDVLYLRDVPETLPALRSRFPDRRFFRIAVLRDAPFLVLVPLDGGAPMALELAS
jgi:dolichyl-phosphate-mannose-protein mannosyltransferase